MDYPVEIRLGSCIGWARNPIGLERLEVSLYKGSDLVHEMMGFRGDFTNELTTLAIEVVRFDFATIWEDMPYRNGPRISLGLFEGFMPPNYKSRVKLGAKALMLLMVNTDRNHEAIAPLFLEGGVNCLYPLEVQRVHNAGLEFIRLKMETNALYPNLTISSLTEQVSSAYWQFKAVLPKF